MTIAEKHDEVLAENPDLSPNQLGAWLMSYYMPEEVDEFLTAKYGADWRDQTGG